MKRDIKVQVTFSEGYQERFTAACIKVAMKRLERQERESAQADEEADAETA